MNLPKIRKSKSPSVRTTRGFTLIELLVVIAVLGILSGITLSVLNPNTFFGKGRDAERKSDLQAVKAALEQYYLDNGREFPTTDDFSAETLSDYLKSDGAMTDPQGGAYGYTVSSSQKCFQLTAGNFENGSCTVCGGSLSCQNTEGYSCSCD